MASELHYGRTGRESGIEQSRPVEMDAEVVTPCYLADLIQARHRVDAAAAAVVGVLQTDKAGRRLMNVSRPYDALNLPGREDAVLSLEAAELATRDHGGGCALVVEDVGVAVDDDLVPGADVGLDGHLIGHGPRSHEEAGLLVEEGGGHLLEEIDGRVLAEHVVSHLGGGHGLSHGGGRAGYCITAKIDHDALPPRFVALLSTGTRVSQSSAASAE